MLIKINEDLYIMKDKIVSVFAGEGMRIRINCINDIVYNLNFSTNADIENKIDYIYKQINMS